jgi:transcriptional regulator with XRE-family HTH domain
MGAMAKQRDLTAREKAVLDRVAEKLTVLGWSWSELARRVGKTTSSASQWSGKRSFPRENVLYMISRELGVDMGWLLTGDEGGERRLAQTETELRLLELLRQMAPDEQRAVIAAATGIKGSLTKK